MYVLFSKKTIWSHYNTLLYVAIIRMKNKITEESSIYNFIIKLHSILGNK